MTLCPWRGAARVERFFCFEDGAAGRVAAAWLELVLPPASYCHCHCSPALLVRRGAACIDAAAC